MVFFYSPPPMVTFACFWRYDFIHWNTFKLIVTIYMPLPCVWRLYLMFLISQCWTLLFCGAGNSLCPSRYNMMILPVRCNVCVTVLLYFLHHCLVFCLYSVSFFQPPVFVQLISQTEYFSMLCLFKICPYLSLSCVWNFHVCWWLSPFCF